MLYCMHYLVDSLKRLSSYEIRLSTELSTQRRREEKVAAGKYVRERAEFNFDALKRPILEAFTDFCMVIAEAQSLQYCSFKNILNEAYRMIPTLYARFQQAETLEDYLSTIQIITPMFAEVLENRYYESLTLSDYETDFRRAWGEYYQGLDLSNYFVVQIANAIKAPNRVLTVLDTLCKEAHGVFWLQHASNTNFDLFGIDTTECLAAEDRRRYRRVIHGSFKGCKISNECFDLAYCLPKITVNLAMVKGVYLKEERDVLTRMVDYLKPGGVLIYGIPYYRFYREICEHLLKNYENIQVKAELGSPLVVIIANKRSSPLERISLEDTDLYWRLRQMSANYSVVIDLTRVDLQPISVPNFYKELSFFRGSKLSEQELIELFAESSCTKQFWKEQREKRLSEQASRPLLPFSVGQLGLVLTSGCLDGIVDEGNGCKHVIKGRVVKRVESIENYDTQSQQLQVTNTTHNRVEINVLLPNGEYKCLA